jgi:cytochrome c5
MRTPQRKVGQTHFQLNAYLGQSGRRAATFSVRFPCDKKKGLHLMTQALDFYGYFGAPGWDRTNNPCLRRAVLYPLSYGREAADSSSASPAAYNLAAFVPSTTEDFMSDHHDHDEAHTGPIKTPKQLAWAVFFSFVVPVIVIVLLASYVTTSAKPAAGSSALTPEAVAARIAPVGRVEFKDVNDAASMKTGDQVYQAQCAACHAVGAAGAPKFADVSAWGPRIKEGYEHLLNSALKGKGSMGAQGGGDFSDFEIGRAVVYMANQAGGKLAEPKMAAAAASAPN